MSSRAVGVGGEGDPVKEWWKIKTTTTTSEMFMSHHRMNLFAFLKGINNIADLCLAE